MGSRSSPERKAEAALFDPSEYKSKIIGDMSHDLRAPLNTLLILAEQLEDNPGETMTDQQVEYATVIRSAGMDLLKVIDDLVDGAAPEAGATNASRGIPAAGDGLPSRMPVRSLFRSVDADTFRGARVFVVDDEFKNVFAMKALLERGNAVVSFAESGEAAIEMFEGGPDVDMVLMDIKMPGMDGYETIRSIRTIDQYKDLPIIAVTVRSTAGERQRCIDAGATDYVPKPVDTATLVGVITPWLPKPVAATEAGS